MSIHYNVALGVQNDFLFPVQLVSLSVLQPHKHIVTLYGACPTDSVTKRVSDFEGVKLLVSISNVCFFFLTQPFLVLEFAPLSLEKSK